MNVVATFDPSITTTGTFTVPQAQGKMVVWNESNISQQFSFQNGHTAYVAAWTGVLFCGPWGGSTVTWSHQAILSSSSPPISQVVVEVYAVGEPVPGTFPMALTRQANIGNQVNTVGGSATNVQNDNNAAGTSVVEATVLGDASSAVSLTNQGHLALGTNANNGTLAITGLHGNVSVDANGALTVDFHINCNLVIAEASNDFAVHVGAGQRTVDTINGVDTFSVSSSGPNLLAGTLSLLHGSVSRISKFTGMSANGKVTVNHGLGATPDIVLVNFDLSSQPVAATIGASTASYTSTQVDIWATAAANFIALAIKF